MEGELPTPASSPVLVVHPDASTRQRLRGVVEKIGYPVTSYATAEEALTELEVSDVAVVIADAGLGVGFLRTALERRHQSAIIVVGDGQSAIDCFRLGVSDYVLEPAGPDALDRSIHRAVLKRATEKHRHAQEAELRKMARFSAQSRRETVLGVLRDVSLVVEAKYPFLKGHSRRVAALAERLGQRLQLSRHTVAQLRWAGIVHDVGMIVAPDSSLESDSELTPRQLEQVRRHATLGGRLCGAHGLQRIGAWVESHHERLDGSGYPRGLTGADIPVEALVVGIAESYAALTEDRPYRDACAAEEAIGILRGAEDMWFPARLVDELELLTLGRGADSHRRQA